MTASIARPRRRKCSIGAALLRRIATAAALTVGAAQIWALRSVSSGAGGTVWVGEDASSPITNATRLRDDAPGAIAGRGVQQRQQRRVQRQHRQPHSVPRIIWQTSKSTALPPEANATVSSWIDQNPSWEHRLMTDPDVDAFFRTSFPPRVREAYEKLPLGVMKADMWRVAVIYLHGGVYADIDTRSVRPVDSWLRPECRAIIGMESPHAFTNWAFASVPGHPVFERALYRIVEKIERDGGVKPDDEHFVAAYTGPMSLTGAVAEALGSRHEYATDILQDKADLMKAREMGLCLEDHPFFNGGNVDHEFASVGWKNSEGLYARWREERDSVFGKDGGALPREKAKKVGAKKAVHVVGGGRAIIRRGGKEMT